MASQIIKQENYGKIQVDDSEKDVIQIWNIQKKEINLIQIEKENVLKLIELLKKSLK